MDPTRWRDIERICEAALAAPPEQRPAVLDHLCGGDADLRREVEDLLGRTAHTNGFLDRPVLEDAVGAMVDGVGTDEDPEDPLLPEGTRLGPYELGAPIGAGGMGTVYEARDTRLERTVAIKVLPPGFATNPDRRARFEREAKTIAGLNHPHICTLHDTGEAVPAGPGSRASARAGEPVHYLVLECVEGETLAARLERGPLPVALACELGAQIADALSGAHRHGVVHRDLKPANIMLTPGGPGSDGVPHVKLLDFGLAKLTGHGEQPVVSRDGAHVTESDSLTARGTILGTLPYMAPEQLEGKPADARTDLWALGCVLYEMLSGERAFAGDGAVTLMGHILTTQPAPLRDGQPTVPPALDRLVRKCLAKQPDDRWDSAHDVADELRWIVETSTASPVGAPGQVSRSPKRPFVPAAVTLVSIVAAATATWMLTRPAPTPPEVRHVFIDTSPADGLRGPAPVERTMGLNRPRFTAIALSPDGTTLVFSGVQGERQQLYRRRLDEDVAVPMAGTEDAEGPFFSPDGQWVGYWARNTLWKVPADGGSPVELLKTTWGNSSSSWSHRGTIAYDNLSEGPGLSLTPDSGGEPVVVLASGSVTGEFNYALPRFLPDGETLLFTVKKGGRLDGSIAALSTSTGVRTMLVEDAMDARYVPTGHLLYARLGRIWAVPFDLVSLTITGKPAVVLPDVMQSLNSGSDWIDVGAAQISVSASGTLAYVEGGIIPDVQSDLVWVDRTGTVVEELPVPTGHYSAPSVSPDGRRILYCRAGISSSLWYYDVESQTTVLIPTPGADPTFPIWFPDGRRVLYFDYAATTGGLSVVSVDGSAPPTAVHGQRAPAVFELPGTWMPDGSLIYVRHVEANTSLWRLRLEGDVPAPSIVIEAPPSVQRGVRPLGRVNWPAVSPDGLRLAYVSNETGSNEVYVRRLPNLNDARRISRERGMAPVWSRDGRELFYVTASPRKMMAIGVPLEPGSAWGHPRVLFDVPGELHTGTNNVAAYDVSPDGQRFIFVRRPPAATPPPPSRINIVFNWFEELKAKVPRTGTGR